MGFAGVLVTLGPEEVGDGAAVDTVGGGDDPVPRRLPEHLGQAHHRYRAGGYDVGQHLARPHRGQLVDVAHDQQRGFVGRIRHCQPVEAIATTTFTIPRRSDLRGRLIRLGGGMKGSIGATRGRSTPLRDAGRRTDTPGGRLRSRHLWSRSAS